MRRAISPRRWLLSALGLGTLSTVLALIAGFAWFVHLANRPGRAPPAHADGIVAFTGGPERVATALRLLSQGRADRLLLSGIGGGAELTELARGAGVDPAALAWRVTIGRSATTTRGNAIETAAWVREHAIHSLIVVTASYHMPRAVAELARTLPDVALSEAPVVASRPPDVPLRLLAEEYIKFLAANVGLTAVLPDSESLVHAG
jgi:uncharacterized SAM-binding protein YcdF (DUF218 family)